MTWPTIPSGTTTGIPGFQTVGFSLIDDEGLKDSGGVLCNHFTGDHLKIHSILKVQKVAHA